MKKKILGILLTICLLVGMVPITALAGGVTGVTTYQELVDAIAAKKAEGSTGNVYVEPAEDFGWPEIGELTIPANIGIEVSGTWEIPEGITVNFELNCHGISCSELTINGTMHTAYSSQDAILRNCAKVIIGPTGTFTCADDREGQPTVAGQYIPAGTTWEVLAGGTLNPRLYLYGTLTGEGTVSGNISVRGGFSGQDSNAVLSGSLTLENSVQIGGQGYADTLTIPEGSHIKTNFTYRQILISEGGTLALEGQLEIGGTQTSRSGGLGFADGGVLQIGSEGIVTMQYPYEITCESMDAPANPYIIGNGTIEYCAEAENVARYCLFYYDITDHDMTFENVMTGLVPTYIDSTITLSRSWMAGKLPFGDVSENAFYFDAVKWALENEVTSGITPYRFSPSTNCTRGHMVTFLWRAQGSPEPATTECPFTDVQPGTFYYDAVLWALENGVTSGTTPTTFSPSAVLTRGQSVTFLYKAAGEPEVDAELAFEDVKADAFYADAVRWASAEDVTTGTTPTTFSPNASCTRGQIVTLLYRAVGGEQE